MSILVEQQGETIDVIQAHAESAEKDMSHGCVFWLTLITLHSTNTHVYSLKDTEAAVVSARSARKKRWICFIIILGMFDVRLLMRLLTLVVPVILVIIAIVLATQIPPLIRKNQNNGAWSVCSFAAKMQHSRRCEDTNGLLLHIFIHWGLFT